MQLWAPQLLLLGHHSSSSRSLWGRWDKRLHSYVTGLEPGTCQLGGSAKLGLWLGFLTPGPVSVHWATSQGRVGTAVEPFLEWLMSGCWRAAGFQCPSLPASETPLCCTLGSAWGTLLWDEDPRHVAPDPFVSRPELPILPRPWDILLLDSLKWNRLALCLLAA